MAARTQKHRISRFVAGYVTVLGLLAGLGYYAVENSAVAPQQDSITVGGVTSDLAYYDLPRLTISVGGGTGGGGASAPRVRLDLALEVARKDVRIIDGYQPRITDRLESFLSNVSPEQLQKPGAIPWLREQMLKQINSAGSPVPVHDLMFRQLVVM